MASLHVVAHLILTHEQASFAILVRLMYFLWPIVNAKRYAAEQALKEVELEEMLEEQLAMPGEDDEREEQEQWRRPRAEDEAAAEVLPVFESVIEGPEERERQRPRADAGE